MTVKMPGGELEIIAKGAGEKKPHIKSVKLNGKPYTLPYIEYKDLIQGGTLEFEMGK